ncbi:hypothetical protein EW146_g6398 [Bondarzewia mesenterica]|uniref:homogentisate 1,2-dioxygenase n=1 Tax=Bondarzewia mesenterica TaxID=1095465 RepID=A0A4S4LNN4_9AGAM|nr:hypothetical protein EW146_g6398 [Bondarzewia mesenterica]
MLSIPSRRCLRRLAVVRSPLPAFRNTITPSNARYISSNHGVTAKSSYITSTSDKDPYQYQVGFGNRFASEAIPGTLPVAQHSPQRCKYDLYTESMTGTSFMAPRAESKTAWLYRIRPSVAHKGFTRLPDNPDLEHNFSLSLPIALPCSTPSMSMSAGADIVFYQSTSCLSNSVRFSQLTSLRLALRCVWEISPSRMLQAADSYTAIQHRSLFGSQTGIYGNRRPELFQIGLGGLWDPKLPYRSIVV